jgi:hypothetical protein
MLATSTPTAFLRNDSSALIVNAKLADALDQPAAGDLEGNED